MLITVKQYQKKKLYSALCSQISEIFFHCSWFVMHIWEAISKTRASCFIGVSNHSKTIKALCLRPRAFISFLVFGNPDETLALVFEILLLKLINYSCSQKPINDLHLGHVDESWYPMKHQMKHHQVFIRDETCFSSEIKHVFHLRSDMFFIWDQTFAF